jgi:hypothetical protein
MAELKNIHLERAMLGLSEAVASRMRNNVPVDTGRLRRSIKVGRLVETPAGLSEPISFLEYGIFTDQGTKFIPAQRWVDRSIDEVIDAQMKEVADGAAHDVADYIGDVLPDTIDITI